MRFSAHDVFLNATSSAITKAATTATAMTSPTWPTARQQPPGHPVDASEFEAVLQGGHLPPCLLVETGPLAIAPDGTFVYSQFPNNTRSVRPHSIETQIRNTQIKSWTPPCNAHLDPTARMASRSTPLSSFVTKTVLQTAHSPPRLWSLENRASANWSPPSLRRAVLDRTEPNSASARCF